MIRRVGAEFLGTMMLLFVVVGSGISASGLGADGASISLSHAVAVGVGLAALVALFAGVSGAHFNPAVTLAMSMRKSVSGAAAAGYVVAQMSGGVAGVLLAHASFGSTLLQTASKAQSGPGRLVAELVATFVLVGLILGLVDQGREGWVPAALGAWVTAMVLSAASGGLMNPAVTVARVFTDTYTGIAARSAGGYLVAQFAAATVAVLFFGWIKSEPTKGN